MKTHKLCMSRGLAIALIAVVGCEFEAGGLNALDDPEAIEPPRRADGGLFPVRGPRDELTREPPSDAGSPPDSAVPLATGMPPLVAASAVDAATAPVSTAPVSKASDSCDLSGTFALYVDANVHWEGSTLFDIVPIIVPGTGEVLVDVLVKLSGPPDALRASEVRACGAKVPDFAASIGEQYGAVIADETWDALSLRWTTPVQFGCNQPGCSFESDYLLTQFGIGISEHAAWPSSRDPLDVALLRDDDRDGLPGIAVRLRGAAGAEEYEHPPTSFLLSERVREIQLGLRFGADLRGAIRNCGLMTGETETTVLETRALACRLETGQTCTPEQLGFVDDNLPQWKVESARWRAIRIADDSTCQQVRQGRF